MSLHDDASHALRTDPGVWARQRFESGRAWPQVAHELWTLTGVGAGWRTVQRWAQHATPTRVRVVRPDGVDGWLANPPEQRGTDRTQRWNLVDDLERAGQWGYPEALTWAQSVSRTWSGGRKWRGYAETVDE